MAKKRPTPELVRDISNAVAQTGSFSAACRAAVEMIAAALPHYAWVGVYLLEGNELVLGPFVGDATDHTRIPVGRGVCGSAIEQEHDIVVSDVAALDNYLSCSPVVRSEIVVLIRLKNGRIIGQIDVDGHEVGLFDETDHRFLQSAAATLAEKFSASE